MRCRSYKYYTLILGLAICLSGVFPPKTTCADTDTKDNIRQVALTLSPCDAPTPVMKYRLTVPLGQTRRENAALDYYNAVIAAESLISDKIEKIDEWVETPFEELPFEEVKGVLKNLNHAFFMLESGSICRNCQWQVPIEQGFSATLPRLSELRKLAKCLALKARLDIHNGDFDSAIKTLQTGFTCARHIGNDVTLIQSLVGIANTSFMLDEIETLIQQPNAPNLYWALTTLPNPMFNWTDSLEFEYALVEYQWPYLKELDKRIFGEDEMRRYMTTFMFDFDNLMGRTHKEYLSWHVDRTLQTMRLYPEAKKALLQNGKSPEDVNNMPAMQAILLHQYQEFQEMRDKLFCWHYVPYAQAAGPMKEIDKQLSQRQSQPDNPFYQVFPALDRAYYFQARLQRRIAALRCVEALRMAAAQSNGELPQSLETVTAVPLPIDPVTGKAFIYHVEGDKAVLETPPAQYENNDILSYELSLR